MPAKVLLSNKHNSSVLALALLAVAAGARSTRAQAPVESIATQQQKPAASGVPKEGHLEISPPSSSIATPGLNYVLGTDDQVSLTVSDLPEATATTRVDRQGDINIPLAGRVHAAGLTVNQLETEIDKKLTEFVWKPHAMLSVNEVRSQPVTVLGEVANPGIHQLAGNKTLLELISSSGGLRPDAGSAIKITRNLKWGRIPLADAKDDPSGQFSVASVPTKTIGDAVDPSSNLILMPGDVIAVSKAELVYVIGSVKRPGGFVLGQDESISTTRAMALAFGLDKDAAGGRARIERTEPGGTTRTEIPINLKKLLAGKIQDVQLKSNDILYVPSSAAKTILTRTAEAGIQIGTSLAIYR
jgi:polysaccharide export outer membrane protein